jgi:hypothetical protein
MSGNRSAAVDPLHGNLAATRADLRYGEQTVDAPGI